MREAFYDVAVIGGGPAGTAAALWSARYRRRVVLIDAGEQRNRWSEASHGYLGFDGVDPGSVLRSGRRDLERYREVTVLDGRRVVKGSGTDATLFELMLDDDSSVRAGTIVLATGVRDVFPDVPDFEDYFGRSIFTCPSCDGYEAKGMAVAVVGDSTEMSQFATGLLEWATSVVAIGEDDVVGIDGADGQVNALRLSDGTALECDAVFWLMRHEQQSELPAQLGCAFTPDGCVDVDGDGATSVPSVFAAGDMTPGPHLVQIAAAEGARAGIAAAQAARTGDASRH